MWCTINLPWLERENILFWWIVWIPKYLIHTTSPYYPHCMGNMYFLKSGYYKAWSCFQYPECHLKLVMYLSYICKGPIVISAGVWIMLFIWNPWILPSVSSATSVLITFSPVVIWIAGHQNWVNSGVISFVTNRWQHFWCYH